ncbi:Uncharacterised protein [Bordetella pertussis]|nr:Uncharacterised protein [Bordetella pertussis]
MLLPCGTVMPSCDSMLVRLCCVNSVCRTWSPLPSSPTTRPYPISWLPRTPWIEARSLRRSACAAPAPSSSRARTARASGISKTDSEVGNVMIRTAKRSGKSVAASPWSGLRP